jgi:hypothetical protein
LIAKAKESAMPENTREENIGAIWEKKTKKGGSFLSGTITIDGLEYHFVAFKNRFKNGDRHPDYVIPPFRSEPQPARDRTRPAPAATTEEPPAEVQPPQNDLDAPPAGAGESNPVPF